MKRTLTAGDEAVSGLIGGLIGGLGMILLLVIAELIKGSDVAALLVRFNPVGGENALAGGLLHLAVSAIYGIIFGLISWLLFDKWLPARAAGWNILSGLVYGFVLWLLAAGVLLPSASSGLAGLPGWELALAHLVYGGLLGWWMARSKRE